MCLEKYVVFTQVATVSHTLDEKTTELLYGTNSTATWRSGTTTGKTA